MGFFLLNFSSFWILGQAPSLEYIYFAALYKSTTGPFPLDFRVATGVAVFTILYDGKILARRSAP